MTSSSSTTASAIPADERRPLFKPLDSVPDSPTINILPNEVLLLPLSQISPHKRLEVTTAPQQGYDEDHEDDEDHPRKSPADDIIIMSSSAGVIFGRMPYELSDAGFATWMSSFLEYIGEHEQAAWWHSEYDGPWACYVFVPMNTKRTKWLYPHTENGKARTLAILGMLDAYAEDRPWELRLPGWEEAQLRVAQIWGKCYVPVLSKQKRGKGRQDSRRLPTEIKFVWDPVEQIREVRMRDKVWKDDLVLERVEMSLI